MARNRMVMTVSYVLKEEGILLGLKKVGLGQGLWNGFGGSLEEGESVETAAGRELYEECGLRALALKKCGIILTTNEANSVEIELHFFLVTDFEGELVVSDEMIPRWFPVSEVPYGQMWPEDRYLLPEFLAGKLCLGHFHIREDKSIIRYRLKEVKILPDSFDEQRL